jgi:hypothetical protein
MANRNRNGFGRITTTFTVDFHGIPQSRPANGDVVLYHNHRLNRPYRAAASKKKLKGPTRCHKKTKNDKVVAVLVIIFVFPVIECSAVFKQVNNEVISVILAIDHLI